MLVVILIGFWILAFFGTMDVFLWVTGATGALICILGLLTCIVLLRVIQKIETL